MAEKMVNIMENIIKIAVVDDVKASREANARKLIELEQLIGDVSFSLDFYESGVLFLKSEKIYDLVLLDYEMPGKTGIEVAQEIETSPVGTKVVFMSGYPELMRPMQIALQFNCVTSFIFKADSDKEFQFQIKNAIKKIVNTHWFEFQYFLTSKIQDNDKRTSKEYFDKKIDARTILFVTTKEDAKNVVKVSVYDNEDDDYEAFNIAKTLKQLLKELPQGEFEFANRNTIINFRFVHSFTKMTVILRNYDEVPLSRTYRSIFIQNYEKYLRQGFDKL